MATPQNHTVFDPWSSSSTGHQRSDSSSGSAHWRRLRTEKLARQFGSSNTPATETQPGCHDIRSYLGVRKRVDGEGGGGGDMKKTRLENGPTRTTINDTEPPSTSTDPNPSNPSTNIFTGTTIYINGSTAPQISDHALKRLLIAHGANLSLNLARRSVSHVIVGRPSPSASASGAAADSPVPPAGSGAGGGLAARKLQTEIQRSGRQRQVKVVCVEWVLESLKAGKRLSEARFALDVAPAGQQSVLGMFGR